MKKGILVILLLATGLMFSSLSACINNQNNECSGIKWEKNLRIFGQLKSGDHGLEVFSEGSSRVICNESINSIKWYFKAGGKREDLPGKYILAYGKTGQNGSGVNYFSIGKLILVTDEKNPDWLQLNKVTLMGLISSGKENHPAIETNWGSRSKISHHVLGIYEEELTANIGKFAKVVCYMDGETDSRNPWSKEIVVEKIMRISDTPVNDQD